MGRQEACDSAPLARLSQLSLASLAVLRGLCLGVIFCIGNAWASPDLSEYDLVFYDEFSSGTVNTLKWASAPIWGPYVRTNNEDQYYVDEFGINPSHPYSPFQFTADTLKIVADSVASNTAAPSQPAQTNSVWEDFSEYQYSTDYDPTDRSHLSGILSSVNSFNFTHGYIEARARVPSGQGLWPAFWLLTSKYVEDVPEIDIMEYIGQYPNEVNHTAHYFDISNNWSLNSTDTFKTNGPDYSQDFHTYGLLWGPTSISWYVDGIEVKKLTDADFLIAKQSMYIILNLAVGGSWPGPPDATTPFPAEFEIDYVRAYQRIPPALITPAVLANDYELMFFDEFEGNSLNTSKWNTGYLWGPYLQINNEEQVYIDKAGRHSEFNVDPFTVSNDTLKITADNIAANDLPVQPGINDPEWQLYSSHQFSAPYNTTWTPGYSSGVVTSYDAFKFVNGYVEIRAKLPEGDGLWPALWLLNGYYVGPSPEIDIMEMRGAEPNKIQHSYHYLNSIGETISSHTVTTKNVGNYTDEFHTYGVAWNKGEINWYIDGEIKRTLSGPEVSTQLMYVIMNLAVGGNFVGPVNSSFPKSMEIDYVRAYQLKVAESAVIADTTAPTGTIVTPVNTTGVSTITGSYSDDISGVDRLDIRVRRLDLTPDEYWGGNSWLTGSRYLDATLDGNGGWSVSGVDISAAGTYKIQMRIWDGAGNYSSMANNPVASFTVGAADTTVPAGTIDTPVSPTGAYTVTGTYNDDLSGVDRLDIRVRRLDLTPDEYWDGSSWLAGSRYLGATLNGNGGWSVSGVDISEAGTYKIQMRIWDVAGNYSSMSNNPAVSFTVGAADTTAPTGTIDTPVNATGAYIITGSYSDDISGVDRLDIRVRRLDLTPDEYWGGSSWLPGSRYLDATLDGNGGWSVSGVDISAAGTYKIQMRIWDVAGNYSSMSNNPAASFNTD